jgi:hypothetical protein
MKRRRCVEFFGPHGGWICADEVRTTLSIDLIVFRDGLEFRVYDSGRLILRVLLDYRCDAPIWVAPCAMLVQTTIGCCEEN